MATLRLWSPVANHTVPWLLSVLAIALLIVGLTCLLCQKQVADLPLVVIVSVSVVVPAVLGIGLVVDYFSFTRGAGPWSTSGEWLGFTVLLCAAFALPRLGKKAEEKAR